MLIGLVLGLVVGAALGVVAGLLARAGQLSGGRAAEARLEDTLAQNASLAAEVADLRACLADQQERIGAAHTEAARLAAELDGERRAAEQRARTFDETREQLTGEFARLSTLALQRNNEQFLQLADLKLNETRQAAEGELAKRQEAIEQLLRPIGDQLGKYEAGIQRLEVERQRAYTSLTEQMKHLSSSHDQLQRETHNLVTALRSPQTRGRWGELQLRRVVEMAGMIEHCDFDEQSTWESDNGRVRPDMIVHLPGGKNVVVDAKVPMQAFLDAIDADDEVLRRTCMASHGRQMKAHVDALSKKEYWKRVDPSPEFVVAFIPGDPLLVGRARTRTRAHGVRRRQPRPAGHPDVAHRPPPGGRLRMAAGVSGRQRPPRPAARCRALPASLGAGRPRLGGGQGAQRRGRRLQPGGRLTRGAGPRHGPSLRRNGCGRGG